MTLNKFLFEKTVIAALIKDWFMLMSNSSYWNYMIHQFTVLGNLPSRSSLPKVFCKKRCSKKFCKIHRKTPVPETLSLKKSLWHWWLPVNFAKFLKTSFFTEHLRWLLLSQAMWIGLLYWKVENRKKASSSSSALFINVSFYLVES